MSSLKTGILTVSLVAASALTAGCVTTGREFPSDLSWIKQGITKKQDVEMVLGEPYSVGNSSGRVTWTYGFYRYRLVGKSNVKELKFYWQPNGTVDTFSFNSSFPEDTSSRLDSK